MERIRTRVGLVADDDVRFLGRSVFRELAETTRTPFDVMAMALGIVDPDEDDREALRLMTLCLTSADARIWPLKLCRLLASYGDPVVGVHAGGLGEVNRIMGPVLTQGCAEGLVFVRDRLAAGEPIAEVVTALRARFNGRIPGFGVPLRPVDERLVALRQRVRGTRLGARPFWQLQERVCVALGEEPNIVIGLTALALDMGLEPRRVGFATVVTIAHVYVAHALEAAETDAALHDLPVEVIAYRGAGPRAVPGARRSASGTLADKGPPA